MHPWVAAPTRALMPAEPFCRMADIE